MERPVRECAQCTEKLMEVLDLLVDLEEDVNDSPAFYLRFDEIEVTNPPDSDTSDTASTDDDSDNELSEGSRDDSTDNAYAEEDISLVTLALRLDPPDDDASAETEF